MTELLQLAIDAPNSWKDSCTNEECTLHQLSPYIGKLKSTIAEDLIQAYSKPGDLIVDPFSGSGSVALQGRLLGRSIFAADISPYSMILTRGKLSAPSLFEDAESNLEGILKKSDTYPEPDLRRVPEWVRRFFHPRTLKEALKIARACKEMKNTFIFACLLGILHHQRPGFLSYPSSHLVPYLRDKKFPRDEYPEMYGYRAVEPRLRAKVKRAYKRHSPVPNNVDWTFRKSDILNLKFPKKFDCLITSPPYMNALDYGRDNRLRLWFVKPEAVATVDNPLVRDRSSFMKAMGSLARGIQENMKDDGFCAMVVGTGVTRSYSDHPAEIVCDVFQEKAPRLYLTSVTRDEIPDIRRSRKQCKATKAEHILVFRKS